MVGNNGEGKTNLLEAVELLGSLRSHRCSQDRDLIQRGAGSSVLRAGVEGPGARTTCWPWSCGARAAGRCCATATGWNATAI